MRLIDYVLDALGAVMLLLWVVVFNYIIWGIGL